MANNSQKKNYSKQIYFGGEKREKKKKTQEQLHAQEIAIWQLWPREKPHHLGICGASQWKEKPGLPWPPQQPIAIFLLPVFAYISMHI